ncbi:MAG: SDR family oxidoreductase [Verrucomicrobia bacterium]|nr:SDR family oxidoreductase [Verrucomicrobiota bacterium]MBT7066763.1 SDR family oxidoreductase [Verrucomicrobiota bacterium]MBT7700933.1 SDR family oxidoreductase [Verrucomicrobiota bacterium]
MVEHGKTYVVMGLLDADSLAYSIGKTIQAHGGKVVFTVQNEVFKRRFLDSSKSISDVDKAALDFRFCDITKEDQVRDVFAELAPVAGVVHSIAFANPRTCLGEEFHTDATDDILLSHHISCVSLATVARYAVPAMAEGGSMVAMSFDTGHVYPHYNWMGVQKSALEALVRALARRHGRDGVRCNAVSAGPLFTKAASKIPGFGGLTKLWQASSPLPWDTRADKQAVANAVVFLLGPLSAKTTGQVLTVDGGASMMGGGLMEHEREPVVVSASEAV